MATSGDLISVISSFSGWSRTHVFDVDRRLAAAGLRTVGGRGVNAAKMTEVDATNLILGVLLTHRDGADIGAAVSAMAVETPCDRTDAALRARYDLEWWRWPVTSAWDMHGLEQIHTLADLIGHLLRPLPSGAHILGFDDARIEIDDRGAAWVALSKGMENQARVYGHDLGNRRTYVAAGGADGGQLRYVGLATLKAVAECLAGRSSVEIADERDGVALRYADVLDRVGG